MSIMTMHRCKGCGLTESEPKGSGCNSNEWEAVEFVEVSYLVSDAVVEQITERLCGDTMAVIETLSPDKREEYRASMFKRTRRALADALKENDS